MGINPFDHGSAVHTDVMKTEGLKQALDKYGFDAAFGGARRDEEKLARQGAGVLVPLRPAPLGPQEPAARAVAALQRAQAPGRERSASSRCRTGPSSTSGSTSTCEQIPIVPLYFAAERPVVERDGTLIMVDDERMPLAPGEQPADAQGAVPHAGLLPADRARSRATPTRSPEIIAGDAAGHAPPSARGG